jgi:hypothetical protein
MKVCKPFLFALAALFSSPVFVRNACSQNQPVGDSLKIIEKVYLHVDRESYYPGDDIWFKAYLVDASDNLLSSNSINLHIELISPDLKIIDSRVVKLENGMGHGDFHLSEKFTSGRYRIRSYTNYMRNFGDELFFNKEIVVINSSDALKAFSENSEKNKHQPEIYFFPEGGSLVENVTSRIAFKVVDDNGYGYNISGEVYSSAGEKVTEIRSTHKGMGNFMLKPLPGFKYFAIIENPGGDSLYFELPETFRTGVVMSISKNQNKELVLTFRTNDRTLPLIMDHELFLTVSERSRPLKSYSFRMKSQNSFLTVPTDDLPEGIIMLTLTGPDSIPLCERLVYIQNNGDVKVKVETEKKEYMQRDSVSVKISLSESSPVPQNAFLSLSATDGFFTENSSVFPSTISSWFLLESDVRGAVEEPSYYFDSSNPDRLKDLDLLLLTQGWRDFRWKYDNIYWPPENGFKISGKVTKKFKNVPLKNSNVNIAIFKSGNPAIRVVQTDSAGRFLLEGIDLTGNSKLVASVTGVRDKPMGILHLDSLGYSPATITSEIDEKKKSAKNNLSGKKYILKTENQFFKDNLTSYLQYAEVNNSIQKKYKLSDTIAPGEVQIVAVRSSAPESALSKNRRYLMGTPDISVIVTPQMEKYSNVFKMMRATFFYGVSIKNPIFLLNGMPVAGETLAGLPVSWIERVDVSDKISSYSIWGAGTGEIPIDGVISIVTRDKELPTTSTPVYHSVNVNFSGYNEHRIFYSPKHHTTLEKDYKPDLRTTLFWEPDIKIENNKEVILNYYNADNPSKVKIIAEGITTNGIPVSVKTEYDVK